MNTNSNFNQFLNGSNKIDGVYLSSNSNFTRVTRDFELFKPNSGCQQGGCYDPIDFKNVSSIGAKIQANAKKRSPLLSSVNEITAKGIMPFENQQPQAGDLSGLRRINNVKIANTWDSVTNERILSLSEKLQPKATSFVNRVYNELNIKLRITDGYRSIQEQNALYAQGRTVPGEIVTHARGGQSLHNYRKAFDVVQMKNGIPIWEKLSNDIVNIASELGLEWGGHWNTFKDYPHFYIK